MPLIEARRAGAAVALARTADFARSDDDMLEALAANVVACADTDDAGVLFEDLDALPRPVVSRAVRHVCWRLGVEPTAADVALLLASDGARCGQVVARRIGGRLAIMRDPAPVPRDVPVTASLVSPDWGVRAALGRPKRWTCPVPSGAPLLLRSRRPGDRVRTRAGTRKVSDVLIDAKIPRALRDFVPILATPDAALAVVGLTKPDARTGAAVVGVEPDAPSWSRAAVWMERSDSVR
jgi:tRNA(Ile)-lysidine synthase